MQGSCEAAPALGAAPGCSGGTGGRSQMCREAQVAFLDFVRRRSHSLFSALSSSVASSSLFSCWKEGFPVLFCSFTQYLWYCCVLLSSESERRQKSSRYCILFLELLHRPSASVSVAGCPLFQGSNRSEATLDGFAAAYKVLNNRNVINQHFWSSNPRHITFSGKKGLLLMDKILVGIFGL